jgi:aryl-alcohol dehydrogenase-like predicted oxidoreductase
MNFKTKLGIGTVQFGISYGINNVAGKTSENEVKEILNYASLNEIEYIDTASAYGNAEDVIGKNDLSNFKVVSKFMPPVGGDLISKQLNESLTKLKIDSLYGYMAHRPLALINDFNCWKELELLKKEGLVKKIGFSLNKVSELETLLEHGLIPDLIQVPYNYFDSRFEKQMIFLKDNGCEIHTRSTFLQGLFFSDTDKLSAYFDEAKPIINLLQKNIKHLSASLLNYVLCKKFIDKVIVGVENVNQLKQNIETLISAETLPVNAFSVSENILMPAKWPNKVT